MANKLKLAVITGGHPVPVPAFRDLFDGMSDFDVYQQDLDNVAASAEDGTFEMYEAFLFYNMHYWGKLSVRNNMDEAIPGVAAEDGDEVADGDDGDGREIGAQHGIDRATELADAAAIVADERMRVGYAASAAE